MGSRSNSRSSNKTNKFAFNNVDYGGNGGGSPGPKNVNLGASESKIGDVNVTTLATDHGAVDVSGKLAKEALKQMGKQAGKSSDVAKDLGEKAMDTADKFGDRAFDTAKDMTENNTEFFKDVQQNYNALTGSLMSFTGKQATQAEKATQKALDYVYKSTRSDAANVTQSTTKYTLAALVAVVLMVVFVPKMRG